MRRIARASQATGIPVGDIEFYDKMVPFKVSLDGEIESPKGAEPFLGTLAKWARSAG